MDLSLLADNLLSPPILFFALGVIAGLLKSDLAIPEAVTKLLALYLMWAIGIKGGVSIRAAGVTEEAVWSLALALFMATLVPMCVFPILKRPLGRENAAAMAAVYGSVSAVTFLTAAAFLARKGVESGGHMVAALALMESPAILLGVLFARSGRRADGRPMPPLSSSVREAALNGPVVLLTGSMVIGAVTGATGHEMLKPLYLDLFQPILTFFLLELGLVAARRSRVLRVVGWRLPLFGIVTPLVAALVSAALARAVNLSEGNAFLLVVLSASASYIAAPAALRHAVPRANPGLYVPMSLAVTFPFNITLGLPLYWGLVQWWW